MLQSWCDLWQECKQPCKLIILWPRTFVRPTSSLDSYIGQGETPRLHSMGWKRTCPLPSISSQRKAFKVLLQSLLAIHQLLPSKKGSRTWWKYPWARRSLTVREKLLVLLANVKVMRPSNTKFRAAGEIIPICFASLLLHSVLFTLTPSTNLSQTRADNCLPARILTNVPSDMTQCFSIGCLRVRTNQIGLKLTLRSNGPHLLTKFT